MKEKLSVRIKRMIGLLNPFVLRREIESLGRSLGNLNCQLANIRGELAQCENSLSYRIQEFGRVSMALEKFTNPPQGDTL